ncbi:aldo/keto reductase [Leptospira yasudae]|uniref:aldo/keto reductase n=1 Tax=Leptospira yasudae TaxID=2202201 RepID=UPI001090C973|nr:aldo/keto reductase [Leptospira yasudae]TGM95891.1 aldo/keto reductase [Leptospira yasudae]
MSLDNQSEKSIFNKLTLGTVQFGVPYGIANKSGQINLKEASAIVDLARSKGIHTIDTAMTYGESEETLGKIGVADFLVITKLPAPPNGLSDFKSWVKTSVYKSLERLDISFIEGLLLHRSDLLYSSYHEELIFAVEELKREGILKKFGISIYSSDEVHLDLLKSIVDIVQAPVNIIDRTIFETGLFADLKKRNIEIHARSIFLQGLLLLTRDQRPKKFDKWDHIWSKYDHWLEIHGISRLSACLSFVKSFSDLDKIIFGVDSVDHLSEILLNYKSELKIVFPEDLSSQDRDLIHPSNWSKF